MFEPLVVFVDDESSTLSAITRLMARLPLRVHTFTDPGKALELIAEMSPAAIVSDFNMPIMNGIELLRRAAVLRPAASRLLITGYADVQTAIDAINKGAVSRFLSKPWEDDDLKRVVLDETAVATLDALVAAIPPFLGSIIGMQGPEEVAAALEAFLRETVGLDMTPPGAADTAEAIAVDAGNRSLRVMLSMEHRAVFLDDTLRNRLRDLVEIVARSSLLVASQRALETELRRISDTDGLSGVLNRRAMDRELKREIDRSTRYGSSLCLLLVDIDKFKDINDTAGHQAGDMVISEIGRVLRAITRSTDVSARYGGDEFCLLLPGLDIGHAVLAAGRLRAAAAEIVIPGMTGTRVTLSVGISAWEPGLDLAEMLKRADGGVYRVKESGRDGVSVHGSDQVLRDT